MKGISLKMSSFRVRLMIMLALLGCISIGAGLKTASAQSRAYVGNRFDNTVSVIDTGTNAVIATVPVGSSPFGVAITPDGARAYVANPFSNRVSRGSLRDATKQHAMVCSFLTSAEYQLRFSPVVTHGNAECPQ